MEKIETLSYLQELCRADIQEKSRRHGPKSLPACEAESVMEFVGAELVRARAEAQRIKELEAARQQYVRDAILWATARLTVIKMDPELANYLSIKVPELAEMPKDLREHFPFITISAQKLVENREWIVTAHSNTTDLGAAMPLPVTIPMRRPE